MKRRPKLNAEIQFLNVDLQVASPEDLGPLVAALGEGISVLGNYRWRRSNWLNLEVIGHQPFDWKAPGPVISEFVKRLKRLKGKPRKLWTGARVRDFNVGIEAGLKPNSAAFILDPDVVKSVALLHGRIVFTVYSPALRTLGKKAGK